MTKSGSQGSGWRISQWLDWTFDIAMAADAIVLTADSLTDEILVGLWHSGRELAIGWSHDLDRLEPASSTSLSPGWRDQLEHAVVEMMTGELALRVGCTILAAHDRRQGRSSARPIAVSVMDTVAHARQKMLSLLLNLPDTAELDRYRRRCERWTDVLIGPTLVRFGETGFAHDARRSWEFGEEHCQQETATTAATLLRAGYRTAFRCELTADLLKSTAWRGWCSAMMGAYSQTSAAHQFANWTFRLAAAESGTVDGWEAAHDELPGVNARGWSALERALHAALLRLPAE